MSRLEFGPPFSHTPTNNDRILRRFKQRLCPVKAHAVALVGLLVMPGAAHAQWTVTYLHPANATASVANGANGDRQVGYTYDANSHHHASLWSGTAASWVNLSPAGATDSEAGGVYGTQQVGAATIGGNTHAGRWSGSAASWTDLNPAGATASSASGVSGTQQVGTATFNNRNHAGLWSGTASSWVDLNPAGALESFASATTGTQQVGTSNFGGINHASLWSGSAASFVDLNPDGVNSSSALGISGTQQVGTTGVGGGTFITHASLWNGTAASWVDLDPAGAFGSVAYATDGVQQAGTVLFFEITPTGTRFVRHASLWNGTADSRVDLSTYVTGNWGDTVAEAIWSNGATTFIAGYGYNNDAGRSEALLWTNTVPEPSTAALLYLCGLTAMRRRRCGAV